LIKNTNEAGNSMNRDAKELQDVLSKTKIFFRLMQQTYREANGERKKLPRWLTKWFTGADGNEKEPESDEDDDIEDYSFRLTF